jgi:hypothetical protein
MVRLGRFRDREKVDRKIGYDQYFMDCLVAQLELADSSDWQ